jgi:antitoxin (DNA-binding transcriptional repressor) of toxin-antitoxin stability system
VKTADSTTILRKFGRCLSMIEAGQSIRITKHGRSVARLVPDPGFMSGKEFAQLFSDYSADAVDKAAAKQIAKNIAQLDAEVDDALAH